MIKKTARQLAEHPHITKPARQKDLYNCLAATLGDDQALNASIDQKRLKQATLHGDILLVEDNPVNQDMMLEMLKLLGLTVELAENGEDAVTRLCERRFDMVFMDCQMPVMDGFVATAAIRQREFHLNEDYRQPIVALTANALQGDRERCINAGMDDYLSKPISMAELKLSLQKWLSQDEESTDAITEAENTPVEATTVAVMLPAAKISEELPVIDQTVFQELLSMCEQASEGFYDRLATKYIESSAEDIDSIEDAVNRCDSEALRTSAHRLKSSSSNWGGARLSSLCQQLENAGRNNSLDDVSSLLNALKIARNELLSAIDDQQKAA